ncbi:MAG: ATP synthase F1 subunit delta [Candidatus Marinimicrobia bacterium]|jgi:ATP synthase F1 delta subunit|nr:ATP synthase F1 subunit delta [Candidatus Neomarinimicrobiota bacterium]MBT3575228.1 ATP synthase F1 subunit delta [Candidatus Neomarinimicrobiota bacterium]MBT4252810.1 ATP synthase F1 subunit delta [Candidatus Neomarinimicrobiota bacterium]MBT4481203.1 ATP synthase F1 subunit delta [Candidatus Neomarinimicrobiota bacterium]MBT5234347.1 ATP synthase F1 subunit delta [Candidatus Neomarinimicrobiota bacterium]
MRTSAKSRQYANLLLNIAEMKDALEPVYRSMKSFYGRYRQEPALKAFLASTKVEAADKIQLLGKVYPDLHPINQAFIAQLGDERDMKLLGMIMHSLETAFYTRSDQVKVHAVSTSKLADSTIDRIRQAVQTVTASKADFTAEVNQDILGGLTLRVGNTILDASLSSKLARIRQTLIQS